jgi:hypothetical protein
MRWHKGIRQRSPQPLDQRLWRALDEWLRDTRQQTVRGQFFRSVVFDHPDLTIS